MRPFLCSFALLVLVASCGPATRPCDSLTCTGCCDSSGLCQSGSVDSACGSKGQQCQSCLGGSSCLTQQCLIASGSGGGSAGGSSGGSSAGGSAGGSTAGGATAGGSAAGGGATSGGSTAGGAAGGSAGGTAGGAGGGAACTMAGAACSVATQCCASNSDCGVTTTSPSVRICCGKQGSPCTLGSCCAPSICRTLSGSIRACQ